MDEALGRQAVRSGLVSRRAFHGLRIEDRDVSKGTRLEPTSLRHSGHERFEELCPQIGRLGDYLRHGQAAVIDGDPQVGAEGAGDDRNPPPGRVVDQELSVPGLRRM